MLALRACMRACVLVYLTCLLALLARLALLCFALLACFAYSRTYLLAFSLGLRAYSLTYFLTFLLHFLASLASLVSRASHRVASHGIDIA